MTRTAVVNVTLGAVAVGLIASSAAWTLLHADSSREVAPVAVSALSDVSADPAADVSADPSAGASSAPSGDATDPASVPSSLPSSDDASSDDAVAVPEGVTVDRARRIALGVKAGSVHEVELEDVGGRTAWKVDIRGAGGRWDVYVDAVTGEVLSTRAHD